MLHDKTWFLTLTPLLPTRIERRSILIFYNQSINQSKHISIAPYVASESEAFACSRTVGLSWSLELFRLLRSSTSGAHVAFQGRACNYYYYYYRTKSTIWTNKQHIA